MLSAAFNSHESLKNYRLVLDLNESIVHACGHNSAILKSIEFINWFISRVSIAIHEK
jgi:hypothetical protein